jgi:hypothetical protein
VKAHLWIFCQELLHVLRPVRGKVIEHDMDLLCMLEIAVFSSTQKHGRVL